MMAQVTTTTMAHELNDWLRRFGLDAFLHGHVAEVVARLPDHVRDDFVGDPCFVLCDYEPGPGHFCVPVGPPRNGKGSRSVVLKRTLRHRSVSFIRYVIAHELAHAHLRNKGRWPGEDPEHAADALAADWGFPRVAWR